MIHRGARAFFVTTPLAAMVFGCGGEPAEKAGQAPITKEMEAQAEASSKYMMEQMQPKKAQSQ